MEDYECKVINLHAIKPRILANLLVISNITSNFTSETDRIKVRGGAMGGGPTPSTRASPRLYSRPEEYLPFRQEEPLPFRQDWGRW